DQPVNFVRHFVSGLHESLFEDSVLSGFLNRRDKNFLVAQKKAMQDAVQTYFRSDKTERWLTPKDMGDIPCLYDENEEWHPAKEFAVGRGTLLTVLEYRGLHPELAKWPEETLKAIGVTSRLDSGKLASRISQL